MVGEQTASSRSDQPRLYGRGDLLAGVVLDQELEIFRDDQPLYHANIKGWSPNGKEAQRIKALELAAESKRLLHDE